MTLGWRAAFAYPFDDPAWKRKLFVGGFLMLLFPPIGWTMALGYRRGAGIRLRAGARPPLPEWGGSAWSFYTGGAAAVGIILGYFGPFLVLYSALAFRSSLMIGEHLPEIALFFALIAVFPPLFLPLLPGLYAYAFPWIQITSAQTTVLVALFFGTAFVLPAAFVQVSVTGRFRSAFRLGAVARFIVGHPALYCEAWILSLVASAVGVALGPLSPWGLFWSYIVILHAFTEAFLRTRRADAVAAFAASPLMARIAAERAGSHEYQERRAS
jgi:hypothetical protein